MSKNVQKALLPNKSHHAKHRFFLGNQNTDTTLTPDCRLPQSRFAKTKLSRTKEEEEVKL